MMKKEMLVAKVCSARCNHKVMLNLVEKLTEKEAETILTLIKNVELEAKRESKRELIRKPWKLLR